MSAQHFYFCFGNFDVVSANVQRLLCEINAYCLVEMILVRHSMNFMLSPAIYFILVYAHWLLFQFLMYLPVYYVYSWVHLIAYVGIVLTMKHNLIICWIAKQHLAEWREKKEKQIVREEKRDKFKTCQSGFFSVLNSILLCVNVAKWM